jgi:hypothetical protein
MVNHEELRFRSGTNPKPITSLAEMGEALLIGRTFCDPSHCLRLRKRSRDVAAMRHTELTGSHAREIATEVILKIGVGIIAQRGIREVDPLC